MSGSTLVRCRGRGVCSRPWGRTRTINRGSPATHVGHWLASIRSGRLRLAIRFGQGSAARLVGCVGAGRALDAVKVDSGLRAHRDGLLLSAALTRHSEGGGSICSRAATSAATSLTCHVKSPQMRLATRWAQSGKPQTKALNYWGSGHAPERCGSCPTVNGDHRFLGQTKSGCGQGRFGASSHP